MTKRVFANLSDAIKSKTIKYIWLNNIKIFAWPYNIIVYDDSISFTTDITLDKQPHSFTVHRKDIRRIDFA
jgi:hypothetical protein